MLSLTNRVVKKIVAAWLRLSKVQARNWEDPGLLISAKALMSTEYWRSLGGELRLADKEFRVYSEYYDDGIIRFLDYTLNIRSRNFKSKYRVQVPELSVAEGFDQTKFRDSRDKEENLSYEYWEDSAYKIRGLPVVNTDSDQIEPF